MTLAVSCINSDLNVPTINKGSVLRPCVGKNNIQKEKVESFWRTKKVSKKMIEVRDAKFKTIEIEENVLVNILKVDRRPIDTYYILKL